MLAQARFIIMLKAQVPLPVTSRTTLLYHQVSSSMLAQALLRRTSNTLAQANAVNMFKTQVPLPVTPRQYQDPSSMLAQAPFRHSSTTLAQATIIIKLKAQVPLLVTLITTLRQPLNSSRQDSACSAGSRTPTASPCVAVGRKLRGRPYADREPLRRRTSPVVKSALQLLALVLGTICVV